MSRNRFVVAVLVTAVLAVASQGAAGPGPVFGDFTISPTSGKAGRSVQITASDTDLPACSELQPTPGGFHVLPTFATEVVVTLWTPGKTQVLDQETAMNPIQSGWTVVLTMPAGRPAGSYPITAECVTQGATFGTYNDQVFVLVAPAKPGRAVEAEVTFTG